MENESRELSKTEMNTVNPALNAKTGGFAYSASAVFMLAVSLIAGIILTVAKVENYSDGFWYINFLASPVAIALAVFTTLKIRKVRFKEIFPLKCHAKYYLIALLIVFGLYFSLNQINGLILQLFNIPESEQSRKLTEYILSLSGGRAVLAILIIAVLPAIFEELLFRGVILNGCESDMGTVRTVLIVGFCFSLMHGSIEQTVYQFIAGCLFALVAVRAGSIIPCILMHFVNNALTIILAICGLYDEAGNAVISFGVNIAFIVIGAAALVGGIVWLVLDKKPVKKCNAGSVKGFFLYASVGVAAFAVLWILSLFGVG